MIRYIFIVLALSAVIALDNGLGATPPLGFNTWNHFGCDINEQIIKDSADALISLGLKELGYIYVNIDDCWMGKERDANKRLVPDKNRFPNGIKALAAYCHAKGLKLGIYSSAGYKTCQGLPASLGYEDIDAATWASWDIDYLKYDNCNHDKQSAIDRYSKMRDALNKTGRPMFYSICNWGQEKVWEWGAKVGNSWRTTGDIVDNFDSMRSIYKRNVVLYEWGKPGGWNDPDMLEVGNGHMETHEYITHFSLWAMAKSPLLIGCDLKKIKKKDLDILKNKDIIDLNQDKLGKQAVCMKGCRDADFGKDAQVPQITLLELSDDNYAVAITNWGNNKAFIGTRIDFKELGLKSDTYNVKDLWEKVDLGVRKNFFIHEIIVNHHTAVYRLTQV